MVNRWIRYYYEYMPPEVDNWYGNFQLSDYTIWASIWALYENRESMTISSEILGV